LEIWDFANSQRVQRADLAGALLPAPAVVKALGEAVKLDGERDVVRKVCEALLEEWTEQALNTAKRTRAGLILAALRALDDAFEHIHPRTGLLAPGMGSIVVPAWLARMRDHRHRDGRYGTRGDRALIARGPFARGARGARDVASFSLTDQFSACAVVPITFDHDGRTIGISVRVIDQGAAKGVPPRSAAVGAEAITLAPLAEGKDDLVAQARKDGETYYLDVAKGPGFSPQAVFAQILQECSGSDVLLLPELVVDELDVAEMRDMLATCSQTAPRLVVCGSGLVANGEDKPWNQSDIVNGAGTLLWSHRKSYAYGMRRETLQNLVIPGADEADQLMDDISWSSEITVADLEGFGRCLVLICQDLMMDAVDQLVARYEPDWVFVPILDSGTNFKRWPFKRLTDLNAKGPARFIAVSSLTMQHWRKKSFPGEEIGVAVGPRDVPGKDKSKDESNVAREVTCETATRRHATIVWRDGGWLTIDEPKAV
jgi:hypothetical protein